MYTLPPQISHNALRTVAAFFFLKKKELYWQDTANTDYTTIKCQDSKFTKCSYFTGEFLLFYLLLNQNHKRKSIRNMDLLQAFSFDHHSTKMGDQMGLDQTGISSNTVHNMLCFLHTEPFNHTVFSFELLLNVSSVLVHGRQRTAAAAAAGERELLPTCCSCITSNTGRCGRRHPPLSLLPKRGMR